MRLFVAIEVPSDIRSAVAAFSRSFVPLALQTKWVRAESIHITLKFIGGTEPGKFAASNPRWPPFVPIDP